MKEYIDRDSLVGAFLEKEYGSAENKIEYGNAILLIQKQPKANVQEVVYCEYCKHYKKSDIDCTKPTRCQLDTMFKKPYDFCSYGENK